MEALSFNYRYGFSIKNQPVTKLKKGLDKKNIIKISQIKKEPKWMLEFRLKAFEAFEKKDLPKWGVDFSSLNFDDLTYYIKPTDRSFNSWEELPKEIKETYEKIGIPQAERNFLAGVSAQFESEVVYKNINHYLRKKGVIFCDMDTGLRKYPRLVKKYFGKIVSLDDNKFASLNSAFWSGGSFVYVPPKTRVDLPLQAYFRINAARFGQFERTLIIVEEGSFVHYVEGCTAPIYTTSSLHAAVVEIYVKKKARVRYTTVQNWSNNVFNLVTKRAKVYEAGVMEWIDCNLGSKATMKYPSCYLTGKNARGEVLSLAYATSFQHQDAGAKMIHLAENTSSRIISKSIVKDGGRTSYRGLVYIDQKAKNSSSYVSCDALLVDEHSRSDTYPEMKIKNHQTKVEHEATVEKLGTEKIFYLMTRGLSKVDAESLLVNGFIEPITKEIPFEYAIELNRLINLEMSGSVG